MFNIINKIFGGIEERTSQVARQRLQVVLSNDRDIISSDISNQRKVEILAVISKYTDVNKT